MSELFIAQNFSILLSVITLLTGAVWGWNWYLNKYMDTASYQGWFKASTRQEIGSFFPWLAAILVLRSFLFEPFQIPSSSMMPTLLIGDFLWVEKYAYGLKDPVFRHKFMEIKTPERGDIVVFKYPHDTRIDYIKRVIGLPGDTVRYRNKISRGPSGRLLFDKELSIKPACRLEQKSNCPGFQVISHTKLNEQRYRDNGLEFVHASEDLMDYQHEILISEWKDARVNQFFNQNFGTFSVPEGKYFVMGDNRDNSDDSRFWGFVEDRHLVGKAVAIWISFEFERSPDSWLPSWVPTGVRWNRIGGLQ
jgi:signal peptidase I